MEKIIPVSPPQTNRMRGAVTFGENEPTRVDYPVTIEGYNTVFNLYWGPVVYLGNKVSASLILVQVEYHAQEKAHRESLNHREALFSPYRNEGVRILKEFVAEQGYKIKDDLSTVVHACATLEKM